MLTETKVGMDQVYTVCDHTFSSREIMKLCKDLFITRKVKILAPQSQFFGEELDVLSSEYFGAWYQVKIGTTFRGTHKRYTYPNSKIEIGQSTLLEFENHIKTEDIPKDFIGREFKDADIIFLREFFRVEKVFGGFMIVKNIKDTGGLARKITIKEARTYLIIDDPIVHLHI